MPYKWTPAGEMRHIVTVQAPSSNQDASGMPAASWDTVYENVPCKAICRGGSEQFTQQQFEPKRIWEIRMRYLPNITELNGILLGPDDMDQNQHFLDIQNVEDVEFRHRELLITCLERVNWKPYGT